jgi:hypothetical protein
MIHTHRGIQALGDFQIRALQEKISKIQSGLKLLATEIIHVSVKSAK